MAFRADHPPPPLHSIHIKYVCVFLKLQSHKLNGIILIPLVAVVVEIAWNGIEQKKFKSRFRAENRFLIKIESLLRESVSILLFGYTIKNQHHRVCIRGRESWGRFDLYVWIVDMWEHPLHCIESH